MGDWGGGLLSTTTSLVAVAEAAVETSNTLLPTLSTTTTTASSSRALDRFFRCFTIVPLRSIRNSCSRVNRLYSLVVVE